MQGKGKRPTRPPGKKAPDLLSPMAIKDIIPQQPARQDSLTNQLRDLLLAAIRLGMFDAYDHLFSQIMHGDKDTEDTQR